MKATRSISVAQTCPVAGHVEANVAEHVRLAKVAAAEGAHLILFPELSLTGYELGAADRQAFSEHDERLLPIVQAAADLSLIFVVGAPVRLGTRLHIGAIIVYPDGTSGVYTKQRLGAFPESARTDGILPPAEQTVFEVGDRNPLVRMGEQIGAMAVCADIGDPLHAQKAAERGAAFYLASMFVIPSDYEAETAQLRSYAVQHSMAVAFANYGGPTGGLASAGRSAIWSPEGDLLVQLDASGPGVAIAEETDQGWRAKGRVLHAPSEDFRH